MPRGCSTLPQNGNVNCRKIWQPISEVLNSWQPIVEKFPQPRCLPCCQLGSPHSSVKHGFAVSYGHSLPIHPSPICRETLPLNSPEKLQCRFIKFSLSFSPSRKHFFGHYRKVVFSLYFFLSYIQSGQFYSMGKCSHLVHKSQILPLYSEVSRTQKQVAVANSETNSTICWLNLTRIQLTG